MHCVKKLETLFHGLYHLRYRTRLEGGGEEPLYLPATETDSTARIIYRDDFFASALHELAHWCIAGKDRRRQPDYGYWYKRERSLEEQLCFQQVECRPQALEWIFSVACQFPFQPSYDNLMLAELPGGFEQGVWQAVRTYLNEGLPPRAACLAREMSGVFGGVCYLSLDGYNNPLS